MESQACKIPTIPMILLLFRNSFVSFDLPRKDSGASRGMVLSSRWTVVASTGISLGTVVRLRAPHCMIFTFQD